MKKNGIIIFLFFLFLFFFLGKDWVYSLWIQKDFNLAKSIVLESDYQNLKQEYEALLEYHELESPFLQEGITSKVILHDPYYFFEEITILKGSEEGITKGDAVLNEEGLVGIVSKVSKSSSAVKLLTHPETSISVRVENSYGILKMSEGRLIVSDMTNQTPILTDSIVYTSSFTSIPGDIPIGTVKEVLNSTLEQTLVIDPFVDFSKLNYVSIRKSVTNE